MNEMNENIHPGHATLRRLIPDTMLRRDMVRALVTIRARQEITAADVEAYFLVTPACRDLFVLVGDTQHIAAFLNDI